MDELDDLELTLDASTEITGILPDECPHDECDHDTHKRHHPKGDTLDTEPATAEHEAICTHHGIVATENGQQV
jgi:hypothetical protein